MDKLFRLIPLLGLGLVPVATEAAGKSSSSTRAPPPLQTGPVVVDPFEQQISTDDVVRVVNDCLSSISPDFRIDVAVLESRGWSDPFDFEFQIPGNPAVPATMYSDRPGDRLIVEHLSNVKFCNAIGRISGEEQFAEILRALPADAGTELFDDHEGHDQFKQHVLSSTGTDGRSHFQFAERAVLTIQHLIQGGRSIVNVKVSPLKK